MKFTLPSLVEGNDGEESMSSKSSSGPASRGSSLQRTATEEAILTVLDSEPVKPSPEDQSAGLVPDDPDARVARLIIRTDHRRTGSLEGVPPSVGHSRNVSREGLPPSGPSGSPAGHRRNASREGLPPSGPNDKLHKFEKSYVRPKSSEEKRPKPPNVVSSIDESSAEGPESSNHVINVYDRTEATTTGKQPLLNKFSIELRRIDHRSTSEQSSSIPLQAEASVHPESRLLTSAVKADSSAKGFRKPSLEDGERSLHILLAEDNPINQKVATRQLQRHGHRVTIVNDGKLALEAVQANHEAYDLVLMDIQVQFSTF